MTNVLNIEKVPEEFIGEFLGKATTFFLGKAAGSEKLYVNIDKIHPDAKSAKYHSHSKQEEFFLILNGNGTLRMNDMEVPIRKGDFVAKPAGKGIAHQFINTGTEVLEILDIGLCVQGDVAFYPDENMFFLRDENLFFSKQEARQDFTTEPNA
ncbi:cupin domain-containing protein [Paenibacillus tarimensis]